MLQNEYDLILMKQNIIAFKNKKILEESYTPETPP